VMWVSFEDTPNLIRRHPCERRSGDGVMGRWIDGLTDGRDRQRDRRGATCPPPPDTRKVIESIDSICLTLFQS
jgi:hypothetical protein